MAAPAKVNPEWFNSVQAAITDIELRERMLSVIQLDRNTLPSLFEDIAHYILASRQSSSQPSGTSGKKRKLEENGDEGGEDNIVVKSTASTSIAPISDPLVAYECQDVSFQIPARKKLKLEIVANANEPARQEIRLIHPATNQLEYALEALHIDQVFCLPVPEKTQRQWNFVIFPKEDLAADGSHDEQIVFTMNEAAPTNARSVSYVANEHDTYITVTELELARMLQLHGKNVVIPRLEEFASSIPQSHRKGEKAYHVKAHRGSKEGYLFFLQNGIVFGFKKPMAFFPFLSIQSISYTSVLQRTFNLVIATVDPASTDSSASKEVEFSMLDQADFASIDEYVKRHGLNDASMAADRRAKAYNVNKERRAGVAETNGEAVGNDGDNEVEEQKTEQQLQDEEDEEEEDYEASGGESDGEGEYSTDEDEDEDGQGYDEVDDDEGEDEEVEDGGDDE